MNRYLAGWIPGSIVLVSWNVWTGVVPASGALIRLAEGVLTQLSLQMITDEKSGISKPLVAGPIF
jgi:hypothetical protein